jgi:hypothetical protein
VLREVTSEQLDKSVMMNDTYLQSRNSLSTFPLLSSIRHQHTIMDKSIHDQLTAQFQDIVYQVWQHFITCRRERNEHATNQGKLQIIIIHLIFLLICIYS